jgi:NADPH2:quinone reductase
VIPHSDGAGVVDAMGDGVTAARIVERVWVYGAQSYRAFGTAAQLTVVPADQAVALPDQISDAIGPCPGIPGITAHRAVFSDGPVDGAAVLVQGVLGGVGQWRRSLRRGAARR